MGTGRASQPIYNSGKKSSATVEENLFMSYLDTLVFTVSEVTRALKSLDKYVVS